MIRQKINIINGTKYNKLIVINYSHSDRHGKYYLCLCECGVYKKFLGSQLIHGVIKSCGCSRKLLRKPDNAAEIGGIFSHYKASARKRNIKFDLTREQVNILVRKNCYYCGLPPSNFIKMTGHNSTRKDGFYYNGLDRIDSSKDYTISNVVPCCKFCNTTKRDLTKEEFLNNIKRIYNYQRLK